MPRGRKGSGIELRDHVIRIRFTWSGRRYCETLQMEPTPPNVRYAERLAAQIKTDIDRSTFDYQRYFPESKHVEKTTARVVTLRERGDTWLQTKGRLSSATRSQYRNALAFWYELLGADRNIAELPHGELAAKIGDYKWPSGKLCNNYLITLRGLFTLATRDKLIAEDPMTGIENMDLQDPLPDPLTLEEAERVLADMREHYHYQVVNYFDFAFFAGMRPEEQIALKWQDIDWELGTARVERAKSFRGEVTPVKGYKARDVELSERAIAALKRQRQWTFMKDKSVDAGGNDGFIFENPVTDQPWHEARPPRENYWTPTLKRLGIRQRNAYCTRHTFATLLIMGDCNPTWLASQMGNSPRVIFKHYAKWIARADHSRQRTKQNSAFTALAAEFGTELAPAPMNTGRRDWSRTSLPGKPKAKAGSGSQ